MLREPALPLGKRVTPSNFLLEAMEHSSEISLGTEKAKSEFIIAPILNEIHRNNADRISLFSGYAFNVDSKLGLNGRCDFLFTLGRKAVAINNPLFCIVEAKDDAPDHENNYAQCIAEMYAARLFNQQHNNTALNTIYGAVSNGQGWIFIKLEGNQAFIGSKQPYSPQNLPELLGALQSIVDVYKK